VLNWVIIFVFSLIIDVGAVVFTRSVMGRHILVGMLTTATIAGLNWAAIWLVMKQDDSLIIPSIVGHVVGYAVGMLVPLRESEDRGVCQRCHPTTAPVSQSSDPS
jgi:hypothetical protein